MASEMPGVAEDIISIHTPLARRDTCTSVLDP